MRISDWSSDVCSSDLADRVADPFRLLGIVQFAMGAFAIATLAVYLDAFGWMASLIGVLEENEGGYRVRSEEHTSELQSLMRISYAVFCLKNKKKNYTNKAVHKLKTSKPT